MKQTKFKMSLKVILAFIFSIVTILAMTFTSSPEMTMVNAGTSVQYLDANGDMQTATDATEVSSVSDTTVPVYWTDGTYVVTGEKTLSCSIRIDGDVTLILRDNATLTCNGISVYNYHGEKLTICAQSTGANMGTLKAQVKGSTTTDNGQASS